MFCFVTEKLILKANRNGEDEILQICSLLATPICHHSTKFASPWYLNDIWLSAAQHCTMCSQGSTMALQYFGYSRKTVSYTIFLRLFFLCCFKKKTLKLVWLFIFRHQKIIFGTLKISQNDQEIQNLEFESPGFLENQVFLPTEQAGTNIC